MRVVHVEVVLLKGSEASASVVLRAAATLLITEVLASVGCEQACTVVSHQIPSSQGAL